MNYNPETGTVFCHGCTQGMFTRRYDGTYYIGRSLKTDTYTHEGEIRCKFCNVILGYPRDIMSKEKEEGWSL